MLVWPPIAPTEVLERGIDWTLRLGGDLIAQSLWAPSDPPGLTLANDTVIGNDTLVTVSGATLDETYLVTNTVTTNTGQIEVETVQITCVPK